ncbi:uncharacterized protein LOC142890016 [Nelusetta ayraudi]|uniref:uncharacterized protein LOC142890016 n=1 Tax=Nelusetta ayraudi TaxID=303726 RepID=UPI003F729391
MASSKLDSLNLRGRSSLSLDERFSQLTQTQPRLMTSDPTMLCDTAPLVLVLHPGSAQLQGPALSVNRLLKRWRSRKSVWRRLGWLKVNKRRHLSARRGFWSFRKKYKRRSWHRLNFKRRVQWRPLGKRCAGNSHHRLQPQRGVLPSAAARGRGRERACVPTRKQLDAQLDEYMSTTKSRLDKDLDDYMSLTKSRLDNELDEYMSLAGQSDICWQ